TPCMEANSDRSRSNLSWSHSFRILTCAIQQPVLQAHLSRVATRPGLGWIARSFVAGPSVEPRQHVSLSRRDSQLNIWCGGLFDSGAGSIHQALASNPAARAGRHVVSKDIASRRHFLKVTGIAAGPGKNAARATLRLNPSRQDSCIYSRLEF